MGRAAKRSFCYTLTHHRETHQAMLIFAQKQDCFDGLRAESYEYFIILIQALTHPTSLQVKNKITNNTPAFS